MKQNCITISDKTKSNIRVPVLLTFDLDGEVATRLAKQANEPGIIDPEMGQFGPKIGYRNILNLLSTYKIIGSFQIVGKIAEMYPNTLLEISSEGHELAIHSYTHRDYQTLSYHEVDNEIKETKEIIKHITGQIPIGHRSPFWRSSEYTLDLLLKHDIYWNSDMHANFGSNDFIKPYHLADKVMELPSHENIEDWTCFLINRLSGHEVFKLWQKSLYLCYEQNTPCTFVLHPFIIGQPKNLLILESIIRLIISTSNLFYFTCPKDYISKLGYKK